MTLGQIIKNYVDENSMVLFTTRSGLSRAYAYMLINDKSGRGKHINPTIETIQKVANGVGLTLDEIFSILDYDYVVKVKSQETDPETPSTDITARQRFLLHQYEAADERTQAAIDVMLQMDKFEKKESLDA